MVKITKIIKHIVFVLALGMCFSYILTGTIRTESLIMLFYLFISCVYGANIIILCIMDNKHIDNFYKYLSIGISGSAAFFLSYFILFNVQHLITASYMQFNRIVYLTAFYEIISFIFSYKQYKSEYKIKNLIFYNIIILALCFAVSYRGNVVFIDKVHASNIMLISSAATMALSTGFVYVIFLINNKTDMNVADTIMRKRMTFFCILKICALVVMYITFSPVVKRNILAAFNITSYLLMLMVFVSKIILQPEKIIYKELIDKSSSLKGTVKELTNAKRNIEDTAERLLKLINSIPVGVILIRDCKISFANDAFIKMFKINDGKILIGQSFKDIIEDRNSSDNFVLLQNDNDEHKYVFSINNIRLTCSLRLVQSETLGPNAYIAIIENLSEKMDIKKIHEQMEKKRKQENIKDDFLANLSHEFKTPINVIYSAIQMEDLSKRTGNMKDITKYNDIIKKNCYRLIKLINNFIDTTRIEQGTIKTNIKPLNIVSLVEDTTMSVISYAENRGLTITFDTDEEELYVNADNLLIERVVLNLISNAIKYNKDNGHIDVIVQSTEHEAIVSVKDNGIGISKEHQSRMFNRYERLDKDLAREKEGSGLGLNIVKEIIDLHKGRIEVNSEEGVGTSISFVLPVVKGSEDYDAELDTSSCEINSKFKYTADVEMSDIIE